MGEEIVSKRVLQLFPYFSTKPYDLTIQSNPRESRLKLFVTTQKLITEEYLENITYGSALL